jgi:hypothetical protein
LLGDERLHDGGARAPQVLLAFDLDETFGGEFSRVAVEIEAREVVALDISGAPPWALVSELVGRLLAELMCEPGEELGVFDGELAGVLSAIDGAVIGDGEDVKDLGAKLDGLCLDIIGESSGSVRCVSCVASISSTWAR